MANDENKIREQEQKRLGQPAVDQKWIAAEERLQETGFDPIDFAREEDALRTEIGPGNPEEIKIIETSASIERQIIETLKAKENSEKDPMTGLLNRRGYYKEMERLQKAAAHHNEHLRRTDSPNVHEPFSLIMIDIDHFKKINDTYGHHAGDQVLIQLSQRIKGRIRTGDLAARLGGEEFAVVTLASNGSTTKVAEDLRKLMGNKLFSVTNEKGKELKIPVTISLGISVYNPGTTTMEQQADAALYKAKGKGEPEGKGRNRIFYNNGKTVELYDPTLQEEHPTGARVTGDPAEESSGPISAPPASGEFDSEAA